jgi:hypothetical protein
LTREADEEEHAREFKASDLPKSHFSYHEPKPSSAITEPKTPMLATKVRYTAKN